MFRSKARDLVIPQSEHARLAAVLASLWGNEEFERPPIPFDSFVLGVATHDRGYGCLDNLPIGEVSGDEWVAIQAKGAKMRGSDPVAEIVVLNQLRSVVLYSNSAARENLATELQNRIERIFEKILEEEDLCSADFVLANRISNFCDRVSYDFCFEEPTDQEGEWSYSIKVGGVIEISPWPLRVESYGSFILGYQADGYPESLDPVLVPFSIVKRD